jgi:hypothetical protein
MASEAAAPEGDITALPTTLKLSLIVVSEVVCPIDTAMPEVSVAILRAPAVFLI